MINLKKKKILVTGGRGFVGSHVVDCLKKRGVPSKNISTAPSSAFDLRLLKDCRKAVKGHDIVIHLAARSGGIAYNIANPGMLYFDNITMGTFMLEAARLEGIEKFVAVGPSCTYPKHAPIPYEEKDYWDGYPEETSAPYAFAKKMLLVQSQAYRSQYGLDAIYIVPSNVYGPGDDFDPQSSHVIPALIKKINDAIRAKADSIPMWGTGSATRDFLYVGDAAEGIVRAAERYDKPDMVNIGSGTEVSIKEIVETIVKLMKFKGELEWDATKPDGAPRRSLDSRLAKKELAFTAHTSLAKGLEATIDWYKKNRML